MPRHLPGEAFRSECLVSKAKHSLGTKNCHFEVLSEQTINSCGAKIAPISGNFTKVVHLNLLSGV